MLIEKFICVQVKYALSKMLEPEVFQTPFFRLWNICTDTMRHLEDFMYNSYAPRLKVNLYTISSTPVFGCGLSMRSGVEFSTCGIMSELKNEFGILEHLGFWMFTLGMPTLYVLLYFSKYEFGVVMHTLF
jgi:hypothetical protein